MNIQTGPLARQMSCTHEYVYFCRDILYYSQRKTWIDFNNLVNSSERFSINLQPPKIRKELKEGATYYASL